MIKYRGHQYRVAFTEPAWVTKLKAGVAPDTKTHHGHLLKRLKTLQSELDQLVQTHGDYVFDPEDLDQIHEFKRLLARYDLPLVLVETVEEDQPIFFDE